MQELLGIGGMGEVYRARDTRFGRAVAIKILPRAFRDDPDRLARFERETRVLASLNHPNIGAVYNCLGNRRELFYRTLEFTLMVAPYAARETRSGRGSRGCGRRG